MQSEKFMQIVKKIVKKIVSSLINEPQAILSVDFRRLCVGMLAHAHINRDLF